MNRCFPIRLCLALALLSAFLPVSLAAQGQDDPGDTPLGDVARSMRKKTAGSQDVIDNDNLAKVMAQAEKQRPSDSVFKFLMEGEEKGFHVSAPDVTCSLSFTANTKALLANQFAQMDLPAGEVLKLEGPATIEGDALQVSIHNGTDWHVSEVAVALTIVKKAQQEENDAALYPGSIRLIPAVAGVAQEESEVRPEKKPDVTLLYRMRAAAAPYATTVFSAPLNIELAPDQEWHWAIVQAKGYPPQTAVAAIPETTAQSSDLSLLPLTQNVQPLAGTPQDGVRH
jgi:hypothetical protein